MTRTYFSVAIALFGFVLVVIALINGQMVTALWLTLAAAYCSIGVLLGVCQSLSDPLFKAAAGIIGAIGIIAAFLYHSSFDTDLQEAHSAALSSFVEMDIYCKPMPLELQNLTYFGEKACAIQDTENQMSAALELAKGLHFGPTLSILDFAYSSTNAPEKDYCALAYKAADAVCPNAFLSLSSTNKETLLGALK